MSKGPSAPSEEARRSVLGPFRLLDVLGRGGMGLVYRAEHRTTGEQVALKTIRSPAETMQAGLRREIHALGQLRHPGVVRIVAEGVDGGLPWYAMELLEGDTLRARLRGSTEPLAHRLTRLRLLCGTLSFLHGHGVVHHDLKPENVFLRKHGLPVLVDFGIMRRFGGSTGRDALELGATVEGSDAYMAPEQIRGEVVDARADLYALGCMLYESVAGRPPFLHSSTESILHQHLHRPASPPSRFAEGIAEPLDRLILKLLEKRPRDRIGYAGDVAAALIELGADPVDPTPFPAAPPYLYRPAFAGRDDVLPAIERAVDRVGPGHGGLIFLGGESGVGKTRLATEVASTAAWSGLSVLTGECIPIRIGSDSVTGGPLHPFRQFLLAVADRCRARGAAETERLLGARAGVLAPYEPTLAALPGQAALVESPELPPQIARARALRALRDTLHAFAEESPLLLVLDDLQWADELSLSFLQELRDSELAQHAVLVVGTYRADEMSAAGLELVRGRDQAEAPVMNVSLGRLDAVSVSALVGGMLALPDPPPAFVAFLHRQSSGNPFFIGEYLRAAIGAGMLFRDRAGAWRWAELVERSESLDASLAPPRSISELVGKRLVALADDGRALVGLAAVLGREFDEGLLVTTAGVDEAPGMEALEVLRVRQILEEPAPGRLRFVHDKIREIAYARIPEAEARALHGRAAAAIEERYAAAPDFGLHHASLGHHWSKAEVHGSAGRHFGLAADRARSVYANGEAITFYRAAIRETQQASPDPADASRETLARAHESLGDLLGLTGIQVDARDAYGSALARLSPDESVALARLHRKVGKSWDTHHQDEHTLRCYALAEACLGARPHSTQDAGSDAWWREWIQIQLERMLLHYWRADVGAMASLVDTTEQPVTRHGTPSQRKQFYQMRARTSFRRERFALSDETAGFAHAALIASQDSGNPAEIAEATYFWAFTLLFHGRLTQAEMETLAALAGAERIGDLALQLRCLVYLLITYRRLRHVEQARGIVARTLAVANESRMVEYLGVVEASLAWIALRDGDLGRADTKAREALALWGETSVVYAFHWLALLPLLVVELAHDQVEQAAANAQAMLHPAQHRLPDELERALDRGLARMRDGRRADAREELGGAVRAAERLGYL